MEFWQQIEAQVRHAAWEASKLPGPPPMALAREVFSSASPIGRRMGWIEESPMHVYAIMECCPGPLTTAGVLGDTKRGWAFMDRTVALLRKDPWIEDAGWESVNPAVAYFWVRPRLVA